MYKAYVRVSTKEQSFGRQIVAITRYIRYINNQKRGEISLEEVEEEVIDIKEEKGVEVLEGVLVYKDKMSGTRADRPYLNQMLDELKPGDTVIIMDLTRISRSTRDLLAIINKIKEKGASIKSLTESWLDTTDESPNAELILTIMSALSQFERRTLSQRTKEGLEAARQKGHFGGRPNLRKDALDTIKYMVRGGACVPDIVKQTELSRATVYRAIEDLRRMGELN